MVRGYKNFWNYWGKNEWSAGSWCSANSSWAKGNQTGFDIHTHYPHRLGRAAYNKRLQASQSVLSEPTYLASDNKNKVKCCRKNCKTLHKTGSIYGTRSQLW
jgi:hypothetical protein